MSRVRSVLEGAAAQRHAVYLSLINLGAVLYITERERGLGVPVAVTARCPAARNLCARQVAYTRHVLGLLGLS